LKILGAFVLLGIIPPTILAQVAGSNDVSTLLTISNFGVLGIVAFLYFSLVRQLIAQLREERDKAYEELRARNEEDRKLLIPALLRSTEVMARFEPPRPEGVIR
jgi:hypothetical protein